jgi:ParB/RepB/Spo0J family partition protein
MKYTMKKLKLADINFGVRFREDLGDIDSLVESIKEKGVIQPICVDEKMNLLAGGRRYTACKQLGLTDIPAIIRPTEDEIDAREIELFENIHRQDMNWQEKAKLTAKIHELYQEKDINWSGRKTAELLGKSPMTVSNNLRLASAIDVLPDLGKCKTADDAMKVLKKAEEEVIMAELAKRQQARIEREVSKSGGTESPETLIIKKAREDYIISDIFPYLDSLPDNGKINFIECDPPYGINLEAASSDSNPSDSIEKKMKYASYIDIPPNEYKKFLQDILPKLYRVAGDDCTMIWWFNYRWYPDILDLLDEAGWKVDMTPGIWVKNNGSKSMNLDVLTRAYEPFLVCRKGFPLIYIRGRTNVFQYSNDQDAYHPSQRPLSMMRNICQTFAAPGSNILVPFAGSGVTLRAAYLEGMNVKGIDKNPEYKNRFLLKVEEDAKSK